MKCVRCYDNGGSTLDRYTAIYLDQPERGKNVFAARGMSEFPCHPQGFGQFTAAVPGPHLGKCIAFSKLPEACQKLVKADRKE